MPRLSRLHSFLDRFEQRLELDCNRLKRELISQVDQQFGVLRTKVTELRSRFGGSQVLKIRSITFSDDPQVETVQLDQWLQEQRPLVESSGHARDVPSMSTGRKRKSSSTSRSVNHKRQKSGTTDGSSKHQCKSPGCGKSFLNDSLLAVHERIHLNIKPFACTWPGCRYSAVKKGHIVDHVRSKHFKLPVLLKEQARLNVVDNRNPEDYVRVDDELLERRLE